MTDSMSPAVTQYCVTLVGSTSPAVVAAQAFNVTADGSLVLSSERGQNVAAFHVGAWTQVIPVAST